MAEIVNYVDIDQQRNSIYNYKQHPISNAYMLVSASVLGVQDKGFTIFNTDTNLPYWWDGTQFNSFISGSDINTGSFLSTSSFNDFTSSYNTGSFTGSFTGNGSQLTNLPTSSIDTSSFILNSQTSSMSVSSSLYSISSSYSSTASYYNETDPIFVSKSGSYATTGSNSFIGNQTIQGDLSISGSDNVNSTLRFLSGAVITTNGSNLDMTAGPGGWSELGSNNGQNYVWVDDNGLYLVTSWDSNTKTPAWGILTGFRQLVA